MNKAVDNVHELAVPAGDWRAGDGAGLTPQRFAQALGALLSRDAPGVLDLGGQEIVLRAPVVPPAATCGAGSHRRVLRNGTLRCVPSAGWTPQSQQSVASYDPAVPLTLSNVAGIAAIPVGALVEGTGVGREVYVTARRPEAGELTLNRPLWGAAPNQTYVFTRFHYALDLARAQVPPGLSLHDLRIDCGGVASGLRLPVGGEGSVTLAGCDIADIGDRGVTAPGNGGRNLRLVRSAITGSGPDKVALTLDGGGTTLRDMRAEAPVLLLGGGHFVDGAELSGGLVLSGPAGGSAVTGTRFTGCGIELTDEHCVPDGADAPASIGGVSVTGNLFTAADPGPDFRWITVRPHGCGQSIANLSVTGNTFAATGRRVRRVEVVDIAHADLDLARARLVTFDGNVFDGVDQPTVNPVTLEFDQAEQATVWTLNMGDFLPFGGHTRTVTSVVPAGPVRNGMGAVVGARPTIACNAGPQRNYVQLTWPERCRGKVFVTARIDRPA